MVIEPHAVGELLECSAESAFNGLAHAEGRGALAGRLGHDRGRLRGGEPLRLAALPATAAARHSTPRACPRRPLPLIQDGVAHRVVHDTRSGAAGRARSPPGTRWRRAAIRPAPCPPTWCWSAAEPRTRTSSAPPVERGIYVTRLWYANVVRPEESLVTAVTRDGTFLIEDGRDHRARCATCG